MFTNETPPKTTPLGIHRQIIRVDNNQNLIMAYIHKTRGH